MSHDLTTIAKVIPGATVVSDAWGDSLIVGESQPWAPGATLPLECWFLSDGKTLHWVTASEGKGAAGVVPYAALVADGYSFGGIDD